MSYEYVYHDNCVLRKLKNRGDVELHVKGEWTKFPELSDDIRDSAVAAWNEGTPLTEKEAKAKIKKLG